jgi:chitinase
VVKLHTDLRELDDAVNMYLKAGAAPNKLVLGLATYGRGYTLSTASCSTPGCGFSGPSTAGACTGAAGILSYREIQGMQANIVFDAASSSAYAVRGNQWIGFDNLQSIQKKLEFARSRCMGGVMVWSIDLDSPGTDSLIRQSLGSLGARPKKV